MVSPVSFMNPMSNVTSIYNYGLRGGYVSRLQRAAAPDTPVTPVRSSPAVYSETPARATANVQLGGDRFMNAYYADQAGRSRVIYPEGYSEGAGNGLDTANQNGEMDMFPAGYNILPNAYPAELAGRMRVDYQLPGSQGMGTGEAVETEAALGAEGAQEAAEEGRCQTCEERKYQDGSDDISVSYQTPTKIDPDNVAAAVRGHEMEHVYNEQAKAQREDRKVVSQTVTLHTDICPECGKVYISGGTTRTVTKADDTPQVEAGQDAQGSGKDEK